MASLTIRDLDDELKARLRVRAAHNGRSMEAEVRALLTAALTAQPGPLGSRIHNRFRGRGTDLELPARTDKPRAAALPR